MHVYFRVNSNMMKDIGHLVSVTFFLRHSVHIVSSMPSTSNLGVLNLHATYQNISITPILYSVIASTLHCQGTRNPWYKGLVGMQVH